MTTLCKFRLFICYCTLLCLKRAVPELEYTFCATFNGGSLIYFTYRKKWVVLVPTTCRNSIWQIGCRGRLSTMLRSVKGNRNVGAQPIRVPSTL
jgi:hypothetical protein